jgi:tetratricopeptide (TPR) repeat protein
LQLLTQIARAQGLQRKFKEANQTLSEVNSLLTDQTKIAHIRYLLESGRIHNSSGNPEKAKSYFLEAWKFGNENKLDLYAIDAAHMMGIVTLPEKQLEWNLKALELTEKTEDKRAKGWLGALYNNIGWTYFDMKNYPKALELFQKGLQWQENIGDREGARIAKWTIGRTYRALGKIDAALEIQEQLQQEILENNLPEDGYVYEELGELYRLKNKTNEAKPFFRKAFELLSQDDWLVKNESERLKRLKKLSE